MEFFTWAIWESPATIDVVRPLLTIPELHQSRPQRENMRRRGIAESYRCERIAPNKYYKYFSPAQRFEATNMDDGLHPNAARRSMGSERERE